MLIHPYFANFHEFPACPSCRLSLSSVRVQWTSVEQRCRWVCTKVISTSVKDFSFNFCNKIMINYDKLFPKKFAYLKLDDQTHEFNDCMNSMTAWIQWLHELNDAWIRWLHEFNYYMNSMTAWIQLLHELNYVNHEWIQYETKIKELCQFFDRVKQKCRSTVIFKFLPFSLAAGFSLIYSGGRWI